MTSKTTDLEQLRVARDWSYRELADEIERQTGIRRSSVSLRAICLGLATPHRTTQTALDSFVAKCAAKSAPKARKRA